MWRRCYPCDVWWHGHLRECWSCGKVGIELGAGPRLDVTAYGAVPSQDAAARLSDRIRSRVAAEESGSEAPGDDPGADGPWDSPSLGVCSA